jgi:integrase
VLALLGSRAGTWEGGRLHALAAVAAYTGLRRDELLHLQCADVRPGAGVIDVVARRRLKTEGSAAPVPIPPELGAILEIWIPLAGSDWLFPGVRKKSVPWTGGALGNRPCDHLRRAGEECGLAGLTFLSLRHTFATWARRRWGLSAIELQDCLRHSSPATQRHYLHADRAGLVESVRNVSYPGVADVAKKPHTSDNGC